MKKRILYPLLVAALLSAVTTIGADIRQGLVSYWPLDTLDLLNFNTPDVVSSNNMLLANIPDNTAQTAGQFGQALQFNSALSQYAYFTSPLGVETGLPITRNPVYTVSMWVKGNGVGQTDRRYFSEASPADNNPLFNLGTQQYGTNASTRIFIRNPGTVLVDRQTINAVTNRPTLDNTWHHVAMVYDRGAFRFYVDGNLDYSTTYTQGPSPYDTISIGAIVRAAPGSYFTGAIDDLAVWARALSQAEVQQIMTSSIQTPVPAFAPVFEVSPAGATNLMAGDAWTFSAAVSGTLPISYQWMHGGQEIAGATSTSLALTSLTPADASVYTLVATNAQGQATSAPVTLEFATYATPNLTNRLVSYWPLDSIVGGTKTPDLVSGYDMTLVRMGTTNVVAGKWANAFQFDNASQTILERLDNPGEDLPIYNKSNFTVSVWVKGLAQSDHRVFSEGSTTNGNPLFNIGTHNQGADGSVDSYIRNNSGAVNGDHRHTTGIAYDDTWHHIAYVHRDVGSGQMRAFIYVDGVQDPVVLGPVRPLTANTTTIGGIRRGSASAWFTGLIDEVALWDRALSPEEIQALQVTSITNPPSRLQPLTINSFKADLSAVANGDSTVLRWDVSKDATEISINQGIGDVLPKTLVGIGTNVVTLTNNTTFILTIKRGVDTLSATTAVAVVDGIAPGWTLLDNFDRYAVGQLFGTGYWTDPHGNSAQVVDYKGNRVLTTTTGDSIVFLSLQTLTAKENQARTLFFRLVPGSETASAITNIVGLTDKSQRSYADEFANIGPVIYEAAFTNDLAGRTTNAWFTGARNNVGGALDFPDQPFDADTVYNVWIDITNAPMGDPLYQSDVFSVYIQKEGVAGRTLLFQDYVSDRDLFTVDPVLGGMRPDLDKLVVIGDNATFSAMFDDFYLSKTGYNATVPRPYGFTGGTAPSSLQIRWSGAQLQIQWTSGILQESSSITGGWTDVSGATPPTYTVTPSSGNKFYRARQ